jgi:hypothetical protein
VSGSRPPIEKSSRISKNGPWMSRQTVMTRHLRGKSSRIPSKRHERFKPLECSMHASEIICHLVQTYGFHCRTFTRKRRRTILTANSVDLPLGRMARGGHGLPKVLLGPAMPFLSTPCSRTTLEMVLWPFQGWPTRRVGGLCPSSTPLDTSRRTPLELSANGLVRCSVLWRIFPTAGTQLLHLEWENHRRLAWRAVRNFSCHSLQC